MAGTDAFKEALKVFLSQDPAAVAMASGAHYDPERGVFSLDYCGGKYEIDHSSGLISGVASNGEVPYNDRTLIMQYLAGSSGLPPRGRWLSFLELPEGIHHYAPFQTDALNPLAEKFGRNAESFLGAAASLKGNPLKLGDVAAVIPALPKIPLAVMLWLGDDEFPAKCNILFDAVAPTHLSTASLWVLGVELAGKLIASVRG
jgi:hypothetical protein